MRQFSNLFFAEMPKIVSEILKGSNSKKTSTKSGKAMPSSGMDKHFNPDGGYSNTFSENKKKICSKDEQGTEDKLQAKKLHQQVVGYKVMAHAEIVTVVLI